MLNNQSHNVIEFVTHTVMCNNNNMLCRGGDMSPFEAEEITLAERMMKSEKAGGNYGAGTKEIQERNYIAMREAERKRREMFEDALLDFRAGKVRSFMTRVCPVIISVILFSSLTRSGYWDCTDCTDDRDKQYNRKAAGIKSIH